MSKLTRKYIEEELESITESNLLMKNAAFMVGFDVDSETEKAKESLDNRIKVNMYQTSRIATLKSILEDSK
jgi:hypothetical protein